MVGAEILTLRLSCADARAWSGAGKRPGASAWYDRAERPEKPALSIAEGHVLSIAEGSPTVFNLGYTPEVAERYPRVAELSGGVATGHPRQRDRG